MLKFATAIYITVRGQKSSFPPLNFPLLRKPLFSDHKNISVIIITCKKSFKWGGEEKARINENTDGAEGGEECPWDLFKNIGGSAGTEGDEIHSPSRP